MISKATLKQYTKWRWSYFSDLTIFEFINKQKVTFFSATMSKTFSPLLMPSETFAFFLFFVFLVSWQRLKSSLLWHVAFYRPGPGFLLIWYTWKIYTIDLKKYSCLENNFFSYFLNFFGKGFCFSVVLVTAFFDFLAYKILQNVDLLQTF